MIFIGPQLLSGIGQLCKKYTDMYNSKYYVFGSEIPKSEHGVVFLLPIKQHLDLLPYIRSRVSNLACMTICETETVHEDYGLIMKEFKRVAVSSEFCKKVFSRQFPDNEFYIVHAHVPTPPEKPYTFYHIGNVMDQRKNFREILQAFIRLNEPNSRLVVKATCGQKVEINLPRVEVINGLLPDEEMNKIHDRCDCYVSFSSSEGIGMGAVEAALRDKPVIITDYGASPEYVKTPYTINCTLQKLDKDDFLFKKGMQWGKPNFDQLLEFMKHAYDNRITHMDHSHTKHIVSKKHVLDQFFYNVISRKSNEAN